MNPNIAEILNISENVISEIVARDKRPLQLPDGSKIYRFELHVIDLVGKNKGITINELAKILKVTKGAVSQVITKLAKGAVVEKIKSSGNKKNVNLFLTPKGEDIFSGHRQFHTNINNKIDNYFKKYSEREIDLIKSVLNEIRNLLLQV